MNGLDLTGAIIIRDARSGDAIASLRAALAAPGTRAVVIESALRDPIPRPPQVLAGGNRDLKLVAAEEDGDDALPALAAAVEAAARAELVVLGPGAAAPSANADGQLVVLSALGSAAAGVVNMLPSVGIHVDVGLDACDGLLKVVGLLEASQLRDIKALCLVGLTPSDEVIQGLVALASRIPTVIWDPDPVRVEAWASHGLSATTSLDALTAAADTLLTPTEGRPTTIISTSERLAAMAARCLDANVGLAFEPALRNALASELPQHVALIAPLVIPEAPAVPNLPPRHRRQIGAAASLLRDAGHTVVITLADTDPALAAIRAEAAHQPAIRCVTMRGLADLSEALRLARVARKRAQVVGAPVIAPVFQPEALERLQTIALSALVMRQSALMGPQARAIAEAMTGLKSAPRVTAMSAGHAAAIAGKTQGPVCIGLEVGGLGRHQTAVTPPAPRLCVGSAEAEAAFDGLIGPESVALAYEARYVAAVPAGAACVTLTVDHRAVASAFVYDDGAVSVSGLLPNAGGAAIPKEFKQMLSRIATLLRHLNVVDAARVVLARPPHGTEAVIVEAHIRLSNPNLSSLPR